MSLKNDKLIRCSTRPAKPKTSTKEPTYSYSPRRRVASSFNTPRGDYDASFIHNLSSDCSSSDLTDDFALHNTYGRIVETDQNMNVSLKKLFSELEDMSNDLDFYQEDILSRRDFIKKFEKLKKDQTDVILNQIERIESMDFMIETLRGKIKARDYFLNNFLTQEIDSETEISIPSVSGTYSNFMP